MSEPKFVIFVRKAGSPYERRLPYEMSEKVANRVIRILNALFSPEWLHEVRSL